VSDNFLKEIGRSYIVSAFLPAAFFVSIGYFLFQAFIPLGMVKQIIASGDMAKYQWLVIFILVIWVAFYLYSANDVTVRLFEGYFIPEKYYKNPENWQSQLSWEKVNLPLYTALKEKHSQINLEKVHTDEDTQPHFVAILNALAEIARVNLKKPLNLTSQMPTRLGNVLRSSELYAFERYSIVDTAIWPRLLPVLPPDITKHLEETNNLFMFLLNSAFLVYGLSFFSAITGIFGLMLPMINLPEDFFYIGYGFISAWSYLGLSIIFLIFGYVLYRVAVNAAENFSMYVRASFDLYRINLLRQLHWDPPAELDDEKNLWLEVSKLLIGGERFKVDFSEFTRKFKIDHEPSAAEAGKQDP
jgi:hypothetical protein